jgi:hypothetical protein
MSAAIVYKQGNYAAPQTPQRTVKVTFTAAPAAGDLNVVVVGWNDSAAVVKSVKDKSGNTYGLAAGPTVIRGSCHSPSISPKTSFRLPPEQTPLL